MAHATVAYKPFADGAHPRTCTTSVRTELIQKMPFLRPDLPLLFLGCGACGRFIHKVRHKWHVVGITPQHFFAIVSYCSGSCLRLNLILWAFKVPCLIQLQVSPRRPRIAVLCLCGREGDADYRALLAAAATRHFIGVGVVQNQ